jgi:hypothetical protein
VVLSSKVDGRKSAETATRNLSVVVGQLTFGVFAYFVAKRHLAIPGISLRGVDITTPPDSILCAHTMPSEIGAIRILQMLLVRSAMFIVHVNDEMSPKSAYGNRVMLPLCVTRHSHAYEHQALYSSSSQRKRAVPLQAFRSVELDDPVS